MNVPKLPFGNAEQHDETERFPRLRFIGQVHGTYLIAESHDGMYIVDQHAAQERINYEKFRKQVGEFQLMNRIYWFQLYLIILQVMRWQLKDDSICLSQWVLNLSRLATIVL